MPVSPTTGPVSAAPDDESARSGAAPLIAPLVREAVGPSLPRGPAAASIGVGINSLLVLGVLPVLLGALADEHRLTASGIGLAAMLEILAMGVSTAAMGLIRAPRRMRLIGAAASLALAALDLMSMAPGGVAILVLRAGAGAAEGVLLWITVSMIVRTVTPERWAGVFFTAQTFAQLLLAIAFAAVALPRFGAAGGFAMLAGCSLLGVAPALLAPDRFAPLVVPAGEGEAPPPRGWIALAASLIYVSAGGAVGIYLEPLARQAGLGAGVARTALWVSLAGQVAGGALATALAGRVRYYTVFIAVTVAYLVTWTVLALRQPAWTFVADNALAGVAGLLLAPFLVPMMIDADPSRRSAVQSGAAQLLGGALGPLLASAVVSEQQSRGVLWLGAGLLLAGFAGVSALRFTRGDAVSQLGAVP